MYTMRDLQRTTGYSRDQLRDRLGHLWPIVAQDQRRGPRNGILVGDRTLACLRRLQELEAGELGPQDAAARIIEELGDGGKDATEARQTVAPGEPRLRPTPPSESDWTLQALLAEKDARIQELRERVAFLERRVEALEPLALPPVREEEDRRPWIVRRLSSLISKW